MRKSTLDARRRGHVQLIDLHALNSTETIGREQNNIQVFTSPQFGEIRTTVIDGEPWFVGKDIAERLGYNNTRDALSRHVDAEDRNTVVIPDGKGNPNQTIINESGLYSLVLSSKLESAKAFKRWVTSEVLPTIRKHGAYLPISFSHGDGVMVNATEMAKPFGKRPIDFLRLPSTKEFINELSTVRNLHSEDFVKTINGGTTEQGKGTWMHEDVAMEFARWLSPTLTPTLTPEPTPTPTPKYTPRLTPRLTPKNEKIGLDGAVL